MSFSSKYSGVEFPHERVVRLLIQENTVRTHFGSNFLTFDAINSLLSIKFDEHKKANLCISSKSNSS